MPKQPIPLIRGVYQTSEPYRATLTALGYEPKETSLHDEHPYNARCIGWAVELQLGGAVRGRTGPTLPEAYEALVRALREEGLPAPSEHDLAGAAGRSLPHAASNHA